MKFYVASKVKHAEFWKMLRRTIDITSTWIYEAGQGQTADHAELAQRCLDEIAQADALILLCSPGDILKGASIEAGMALALGKPVFCVGTCETLSKTFTKHPLWHESESVYDAVIDAQVVAAKYRGK